ncbi:MAG: hypothetical protein IPF73_05925 [Betaproteobacteria bacterium]|nr:hypothetical protein [Betaproteobacteria bacterium]
MGACGLVLAERDRVAAAAARDQHADRPTGGAAMQLVAIVAGAAVEERARMADEPVVAFAAVERGARAVGGARHQRVVAGFSVEP